MKYVLITKTGRVMCFYVKAVAETYQQAYGGTVISESLAEEAATAYLNGLFGELV
jgi:hypothetical protein